VANILLDAANWYDGSYGNPPSYWNGSTYDYIGGISTGKYFYGATMQYGGTIAAGDVVSFSIKSTSADPATFHVSVNGTWVFSQILATGVVYPFTSAALNAGDTVTIALGVEDYSYSQDAILIPTPVAVAPSFGLIFATGDSLFSESGPGVLTTVTAPAYVGTVATAASYARTAIGLAAVFFGESPIYTLPLPEDTSDGYTFAPKMQYRWKSKKFVMPAQTTMGAAKVVHGCEGNGVRFRLYVDCCCVFETVVRGCDPFRLPDQIRGMTYEIELIGCSRVTEVIVAPTMRELASE
jgi:hypothetical protein